VFSEAAGKDWRASDGCISQLVWENPDSGATTNDLFIPIQGSV